MPARDQQGQSRVLDPGRVSELAGQIASGRLTPVALVQRYLDRIAAADGDVQCWRELDAKRALAVAAERTAEAKAGRLRGALHGIPVAIKDIIDVEGLPTRANCKARANAAAATGDAEIVAALRRQGAIVLGKVHTTEYAFFDPSPACNPHNLGHTPGGSSSGSAAAVAAGMAPIAVGTQTVASVNRPAAYCGIAAFKPSTRSLSSFGITPLGPSYDTPGFYGWSVADAAYVYDAVQPAFADVGRQAHKASLSIVIPSDPHLGDAVPEMQAALQTTADALDRAGHRVERRASPIAFERLFLIQRSTMLYEAGRALRFLLDHPENQVGAKLREAIHTGLAIEPSRYLDEREEIDRMREALFAASTDIDVFLWPAAPGPAPEGLGWTGDPKYIAPWTALGGPIVTMPAGKTSTGLPLGVIVSSRPGSDTAMSGWARRLAAAAERHD